MCHGGLSRFGPTALGLWTARTSCCPGSASLSRSVWRQAMERQKTGISLARWPLLEGKRASRFSESLAIGCPGRSCYPGAPAGDIRRAVAQSPIGLSDHSPPRAVYSDIGLLHQIRVVLLLRYFDRHRSPAVVRRIRFPRHRIYARAVVVGSGRRRHGNIGYTNTGRLSSRKHI